MRHSPAMLAEFTDRLSRVERYLGSSKLHFHNGVLELNPAPFLHAQEVLPPHSPLAYALLSLREICVSTDDLASRRILAAGLHLWCTARLTATLPQETLPTGVDHPPMSTVDIESHNNL